MSGSRSSSSARRRGGTRGSTAAARAAAKRRSAAQAEAAKAKSRRSRLVAFGVVALLCVVTFVVISRIDFGETIATLTLPLKHEDIIRQQAEEKGVEADLIAAVIYQESKFEDQTSSAGARGLMQITPDTANTIETLSGGETFVYDDLADPDLNIRYGTFYLHHLLERFKGNEVAALAAYNAGPEQAEAWGGSGMDEGDIEFAETKDYVASVLDKRSEYEKTYGHELGL